MHYPGPEVEHSFLRGTLANLDVQATALILNLYPYALPIIGAKNTVSVIWQKLADKPACRPALAKDLYQAGILFVRHKAAH
jgi:hypothetical protein